MNTSVLNGGGNEPANESVQVLGRLLLRSPYCQRQEWEAFGPPSLLKDGCCFLGAEGLTCLSQLR